MKDLSLEQKVRLLTGADFWTLRDEPALGLRRVVTSDGPAGVRGVHWDERDPSANVPSPTALAATWDPELVRRIGSLLAFECRRKGVDVLLAPAVNLHRTPFGGRHFECLSEDPLLTGIIATAMVDGLQSAGVGATVKHFVANDSETERFTYDAHVAERTLRELYLAPFEHVVREARPWAVMAAYNAVDGATMTESPLLDAILRDEWGFDGVVMSDWFAARTTVASARGGLDLVMPGPVGPWDDALLAAVRTGEVPEAAVDAKVERVLRLAQRVGARSGAEALDEPAPWTDAGIAAQLRTGAAASFVLVRNEGGLLPLDAGSVRSLAVLGPHAEIARTLGGGSATVIPSYSVGPLEGLRDVLGAATVTYAPGVRSGTRLPIVPADQLDADGGGGVVLRFLDAGGRELGSERRFAGTFTWLGTTAEGIDLDQVACFELTTRLRPTATGRHLLGVSGVGHHDLTVEGRGLLSVELALAPGADLGEWTMRPPQKGVGVHLEAGEAVDVSLRYRPASSDDAAFGLTEVSFALNLEEPLPTENDALAEAEALARAAEVAVVVVGTTEEDESEGFDRDSLVLPGRQDELVRRVAAANPRTAVVVNAGAPVLMPWADEVAVVLLTWFGGQELGHALADVMLGAAEPGGRLPTTWPSSEAGLPGVTPQDGVLSYAEGLRVGYRDPDARARYPFGHGLGYTDWELLDLRVTGGVAAVTIANTGSRRGREVVQLYAERPGSRVERPARWLVGFAAAELDPGQSATVDIEVTDRALAHWDVAAHAFVVEPGSFTLRAARSSADPGLTTTIER